MMKAIAAGLALLLGLAGDARAETGASDWSGNEAGRVRLVSATTATGDSGMLRLGLAFDLAPGWKIYWRTPGDAGYPPKIDWSGSANIGTPEILWPAPTRFVLAGLQNHGYGGKVVLPLDVPVTAPGEPARIAAELDYLACAEICVPMQASLALDLPAGPAEPTAFVHEISRFAALVPGDGARHGLSIERVEAVGEGDQSFLRVTAASTTAFTAPDLFVEPAEVASFDQPRVRLEQGGTRAIIESPVVPGTLQRNLTEGAVTLTLTDGGRSMQAAAVPAIGSGAAMAATAPEGLGLASLAGMLGIAVLGGLILNLMPCVLPVLSIKVVGVIGYGGAAGGHVRAAFLASAAGIVVSFLALALGAVALKSAGAAVGWGIQFQQPGFLAAMVALLALFGASLWGLFEIPMPSWLMSNAGGDGHPHHSLAGHFMSGAFATLLATPCSAPFLGTAIGFALARGPAEILAIFAALGLGMAIPYLAVAIWPGAASRLPKPGKWMITLRKILALALAGTAVWLLTVLWAQAGTMAAAATGGAMVAAVLLLIARTRLPPGQGARSAASVGVAGLAALAVVAPLQTGFADNGVSEALPDATWRSFDEAAIHTLVAQGQVVFVDVTADWCITCKVNKAAVLDRGEVARRLASGEVVAMRADWTRPDDSIARYLASFGRYGIPFNVVYGPAAPQGVPLSELLTESEVLRALAQASGS